MSSRNILLGVLFTFFLSVYALAWLAVFTGAVIRTVEKILDYYFQKKKTFYDQSLSAAGEEARKGLAASVASRGSSH